jgi:hypothetical protein
MNDRERFIMEIEVNGHTLRDSTLRRMMRLIALILLTGAIVAAIAVDALLATAQAAPARQVEGAAPAGPGSLGLCLISPDRSGLEIKELTAAVHGAVDCV